MATDDGSSADLPEDWDRLLTGPNGSQYRIRAVRKGDPLRDEGSAANDLGDVVVELFIDGTRKAIRTVRRKRGSPSGYTVGITRARKALRDKVVTRVSVPAEGDVAAKLDEFQQAVLNGSID